jgi:hypothetical protein
MAGSKLADRQPGESEDQYSARLKRRAELVHQISEEVRFAAAGQGLTLAEAARRMGDPKGVALSGSGSWSLTKLADASAAIGVTFRLVAIPDSDTRPKVVGPKPPATRKLSPDQVREIRRRVRAGERQVDVARELGYKNPSAISDIVRGRSYKDVDG